MIALRESPEHLIGYELAIIGSWAWNIKSELDKQKTDVKVIRHALDNIFQSIDKAHELMNEK